MNDTDDGCNDMQDVSAPAEGLPPPPDWNDWADGLGLGGTDRHHLGRLVQCERLWGEAVERNRALVDAKGMRPDLPPGWSCSYFADDPTWGKNGDGPGWRLGLEDRFVDGVYASAEDAHAAAWRSFMMIDFPDEEPDDSMVCWVAFADAETVRANNAEDELKFSDEMAEDFRQIVLCLRTELCAELTDLAAIIQHTDGPTAAKLVKELAGRRLMPINLPRRPGSANPEKP